MAWPLPVPQEAREPRRLGKPMLKAVIVGAGLMGRHHARIAARCRAQVTAIVDIDQNAAKRLAAKHPGTKTYASLRNALREQVIDIVHICTPSHTHLDLAKIAARMGVSALIEKPVGEHKIDLLDIIDAFAEAKRSFCPVHQYAFQGAFEDAIQGLHDLGKLLRFDIDIRSAGGPASVEGRDRSVADILPHPLSLIQRVSSDIDIGELEWHLQRAAAGEWHCSAALQDEAIARISLSLTARPTCFNSRLVFTEGEIEIDHFNGFATRLQGPVTRTYKILQPLHRNGRALVMATANLGRRVLSREWAYPGLRELVQLFYLSVSDGHQLRLPISPKDVLAIAHVRDRLLSDAQLIGKGYDH